MHDAGLFTPDLFARHIFVDGDRFALIDMARLDNVRPRATCSIKRDRALAFGFDETEVALPESLRWPEFFRPIERRVQYLLKKRRKFSDFERSAQ